MAQVNSRDILKELWICEYWFGGELHSESCPIYLKTNKGAFWISWDDEHYVWGAIERDELPICPDLGNGFHYNLRNLAKEFELYGLKIASSQTIEIDQISQYELKLENRINLIWDYSFELEKDSLLIDFGY